MNDFELEQRILEFCKEPRDPKILRAFFDKFRIDEQCFNKMVRNLVNQGKLDITLDWKVKTIM